MSQKLGAVKFAYAVLATERKADPSIDLSHAPAAPRIGDIQVFDTDQGAGSIIQEQDHEVLVDLVHLRFIGRGRELPGGDVEFDYETRRLLALIQIGAQTERAVHDLIDQVFGKFEEFSVSMGFENRKALTEGLERLRKEFP
jgi:cold shock CspA family protein